MVLKGKIIFDPDNKTRKHESQASWKLMALLMFGGDVCNYYKWFIKKRYNLELNQPLRGAHISFINDSIADIADGLGITQKEGIAKWREIKKKWNGKEITIELNTDVRSDGKHWWLQIPEDSREKLHRIREELGLARPYFGLHCSIGFANEKNIEHSKYILGLLEKFGDSYN